MRELGFNNFPRRVLSDAPDTPQQHHEETIDRKTERDYEICREEGIQKLNRFLENVNVDDATAASVRRAHMCFLQAIRTTEGASSYLIQSAMCDPDSKESVSVALAHFKKITDGKFAEIPWDPRPRCQDLNDIPARLKCVMESYEIEAGFRDRVSEKLTALDLTIKNRVDRCIAVLVQHLEDSNKSFTSKDYRDAGHSSHDHWLRNAIPTYRKVLETVQLVSELPFASRPENVDAFTSGRGKGKGKGKGGRKGRHRGYKRRHDPWSDGDDSPGLARVR